MAYDPHANFAFSYIASAPSPATSGTSITVVAGDGAKFPAASFNAMIWPINSQPTSANAEIVRVTVISTDTFTITRAQESSSARTVVVGDQIAAGITKKTLTDIEATGKLASAIITSSFTSTNTAATNITNMVVTVTAPGGRDIKLSFSGVCSETNGAGNNWTLDIFDTGASAVVGSPGLITNTTNGFSTDSSFFCIVSAPSAGSHTYQLRFASSAAGTFTLNAGATINPTLLAEVI